MRFFILSFLSLSSSAFAQNPKYGQPYTFEGTFGMSIFENCCIAGVSKKDVYGYITLTEAVALVDRVDTTMYVYDKVQIPFDKKVFNELLLGAKIRLSCGELVEGFNGHYALRVYCSKPMIAVLESRLPETVRGKNGNVWKKNKNNGHWEDTGVKAPR